MSVLSIMEPFADEARRRPQQAAGNDDDAPAPGVTETLGAAFRSARDDTPDHGNEERMYAYGEVVDALAELGFDRMRYVNTTGRGFGEPLNYSTIWQDVEAARARDPKALPGLEKSQTEFDARWERDFRNRMARDVRTASRGPAAVRFAGGMAGVMTDPLTFGSMMLSGGSGPLLRVMAREAVINGATELVQQPLVAGERARYGREWTWSEGATNVALATAAGAAFPAATRGTSAAATKAVDTIAPGWREGRAMLAQTRAMDLPGPSDRELLDAFDTAFPAHSRPPVLHAARNVLAREVEIDEASPFKLSHAGDAAHRGRLAEAMDGLAGGMRPLRGQAAMEGFMARVRGAESGGNDAAANPRSSATGRYQFTDSTWLAMYKRRFGGAGLSDAQIVAKKANGDLQDMLMRDLTADNAAALRKAGVPVTEGNLYLAHFAGERGARKLHAGDPEARVEDVLGGRVVEANPFLRGMTARDVIEWAAGKMGGRRAEFGGAAARAADDTARAPADADAPEVRFDDLDLPELRRDLFEDDAQWEAAQREIDYEVLGIEPLERAAPSPGVSMRPGEDTGASPTAGAMREIAPEPAPVNPAPVRAAESAAPDEASAAMIEVSGLIDDAEAAVRAMDPALAERIGQEAEQAFAALPPDLQAASRAWGVADGGAVQSPVRSFKGPEGRFLWNPQTGEARGAFPKGEGVTADDVRAFLAVPQEPALRDAATARFDDPAGVEADAQADFLAHDLRLLADEGALDGIAFMALRDGAEDSAASIFARLDADAAALEALRGCL